MEKEFGAEGMDFGVEGEQPEQKPVNLGNQVLDLLGQSTQNPAEAFVLLNQLSLYIWDQYKIDWKDTEGHKAAATRKQRYLDFISELINGLEIKEQAEAS